MTAVPHEYVLFMIAVLLFSGFVKGVSGFGIILISVPVLAVLLPPQRAILLMAIPACLLCISSWAITWREWRSLRRLAVFLPFCVPFILLGVRVLLWVPPNGMRATIGVTMLGVAAMRFRGWSAVQLGPLGQRLFAPAMGMASGFFGGAIMAPMPPLILLLNSTFTPREQFVFLVNVIATLSICFQVASFAWLGFYQGGVLGQSLSLLVPALVGLGVGTVVRQWISQDIFERVVLILMALAGVSNLLRALGGVL